MSKDLQFVVDEVRDLMRAGRVGIYEFVEILRGRDPDAVFESSVITARAALSVLLEHETVELGYSRWSDVSYWSDATGIDPVAGDWQSPPEELFLAVRYRNG